MIPNRPRVRRRRRLAARRRYYWSRTRRYVVENVLHATDSPHKLALGAAIGMFVALLPAMGIQMYLTFVIAWMCRANKVIGLPLAWISNPATMIPLYWSLFEVGRRILGYDAMTPGWWRELGDPPSGWIAGPKFYWDKFTEIAWPLWFGCTLVGLILAIATYMIVYFGVRSYRMRKFGTLLPPLHMGALLSKLHVTSSSHEAVTATDGSGSDVTVAPPKLSEAEPAVPPTGSRRSTGNPVGGSSDLI